jgi:DNA-binding transcriptional MerR regulator
MVHNQPIRGGTHGAGASPSEIPDKLYFRIGEVARLCEVPAYVLRFWESEFPQLKPNKGGTGQRLYRRRDVEMALRIKTLLKDEGYTIPGARQVLKAEFKQKEPQLSLLQSSPSSASVKQLRSLRRELESIAAMLAKPPAKPAGPHKANTRETQPNATHPIRSPRRASAPPASIDTPEIPFDPAD